MTPRRHRSTAASRARAAALVLALLAALFLSGPHSLAASAHPAEAAPGQAAPAEAAPGQAAPAQAAGAPANGSVHLAYQTPWVGASGDFTMRLRIDRPPAPSDPEVAVTVFPAVETRSEFALTLADRIDGEPLLPVQTFALSSLVPDSNGEIPVNLRFVDRLSLGRSEGVFPVRVDLRERPRGAAAGRGSQPVRVLRRFVTHIVFVPEAPAGAKLGTALVLPVHAPAGLPPDGARELNDLDHLAAVNAGLDATRNMPVALAPTPESLGNLASSTDDRAVSVLKALQQHAPATTVLAGTYVPTDLPALLASGLAGDAATQVARGISTVADTLRVSPDTRTWWGPGRADDASLALLGSRGFDRMVIGEADLKPPTNQRLTLTQPFVLSAGDVEVPAVVTDPGLSAHFDNRAPPVLSANHLLADLAVIYLDRPGASRRGVVAMPPPSWRVDRQFLETAIGGWTQNPIVEAIDLDMLFSDVEPARSDTGRPLVRVPATAPAGGLADLAPELREARRRLDALGTVLGPGVADHGNLDERLLLAESSNLRTTERKAYVDAVLAGVEDQRQDILMPGGRSITLTARTAEIPLTFQNRTGGPARVVVKLESDKLEFPDGNVQTLELTRRNTTERILVVSRTSGAFPMRISLESPDGNLVLGQARLTVRSTAASSVSLVVSLGAVVFLAVWWGRHALRGRRARRLVPT